MNEESQFRKYFYNISNLRPYWKCIEVWKHQKFKKCLTVGQDTKSEQVMGEPGLGKPLSEDPDNTYLYRELRDQHWDRFKGLISIRKAGILTPDPRLM